MFNSSKEPRHLFRFNKNRGIPNQKEFNKMPWGRQTEYLKKIREFMNESSTEKNHVYCKRRSLAKGLKEFLDLYKVNEYYLLDRSTANYKDDSVEIFFNK